MGAIKSYYHEEICAGEMDNNQDEPTEEQWWEAQDKDSDWIKGKDADREMIGDDADFLENIGDK